MSRIRTNLITNRMANGAPTVSNGLVVSIGSSIGIGTDCPKGGSEVILPPTASQDGLINS